jgi:release factor glutamine methyltransferase
VTVRDAVAGAVAALTSAGFTPADARIDAGVIARHLLGWSLADWAARGHDVAPSDFEQRLAGAVARRSRHEPVAYVTGEKEFYGRAFRVAPGVLIPRPETELVVEEAIRVLSPASAPLVADIGTGSGCLAITVGLECPAAAIIATDVSAEALAVARENAVRLRTGNVQFALVGDLEFVPSAAGPLDLVVSNPPYVPERDRVTLAPDVRDYEPAAALFAGEDGLDVIRALVPAAAARLRPGGTLLMEIGAGQADAVQALLMASGFDPAEPVRDLQGIPRVVRARRA